MMAPDIVKFLTQEFPGETKKILNFDTETWRDILEVEYPYVAYASLRAPLLFVDSEIIDRCCPLRYCFSPRIIEALEGVLVEIPREEPEAFSEWFERVDQVVSEEARRDQERYWRFVSLACYCSDLKGCVPGLSYRGPAILICPERLEERIEEVNRMGAEDSLFYVLKGVYSHEVTHSYIDAWSTNKSPSRTSLARNKNADEFYHALLEESIATALEVGSIPTWKPLLEKAYAAYLLRNLPAEYLGFHYIINRLRDLNLTDNFLGVLPEKYSTEREPPPLWVISFRMIPNRFKEADLLFFEWALRKFFEGTISERELFYYLRRCLRDPRWILREVFGRPMVPETLWKLTALSWLLGSPKRY